MKDYQKVILLLYPKLERMAEDIGNIIQAKAIASYSGKEEAEKSVQKIIDYSYVRECFTFLKAELDEMIAQLSREERYFLEYKYFRRKRMLDGKFADMRFEFCERTYFRRQNKLAQRVNSLFVCRGMDEAWFLKTFGCVPYVMAALENVRKSGASRFVDKRAHGELRCSGTRVRRGEASERKTGEETQKNQFNCS